MKTRIELQSRAIEAAGDAETARLEYIHALKLAKVAKAEVTETRKEWKRANIAHARAQGAMVEAQMDDELDLEIENEHA